MTGTLTVHYRCRRRCTRRCASWAARPVEGRKIFTTGSCYAGDVLAEAEGIFITIEPRAGRRARVAPRRRHHRRACPLPVRQAPGSPQR